MGEIEKDDAVGFFEDELHFVKGRGYGGQPFLLPKVKEYRAAVRAWGERFGLTSADRGRLSINPDPVPTLRERIRSRRRARKTEDEDE